MKKFLFRLSLIVGILAVFVYYISKNIGTIESTVHVTFSQSVGYMLAAFALSATAFFFMVVMNQTVFAMMGIRRTKIEMFLLQVSSLAANVLVPSSGVSVAILFAADAKKHGESEAAAVTAAILSLMSDYISIAVLLIFAMFFLNRAGSLELRVVIPSLSFLAITGGMYWLIYSAGKNKPTLKRFLDWAKRVTNKVLIPFHKKIESTETTIDKFIDELENAYMAISKDKTNLFKAVGAISVSHFMYLAAIYVLFFSLGIEPLYRVLLSGYAIGMMFVVISPTPNGVGFVEGSMVLAYGSLGIPGAAAATVTLIYRGFSFWLPLLIGFLALQRGHLLALFKQHKK
jgi:glycosyltransferase 2 family protein